MKVEDKNKLDKDQKIWKNSLEKLHRHIKFQHRDVASEKADDLDNAPTQTEQPEPEQRRLNKQV